MGENKETFAINFFRIYDRKIASGELTFSTSGIDKNHFTQLCTDQTFVFPEDEIKLFCEKAKLTEAETESLMKWVK